MNYMSRKVTVVTIVQYALDYINSIQSVIWVSHDCTTKETVINRQLTIIITFSRLNLDRTVFIGPVALH